MKKLIFTAIIFLQLYFTFSQVVINEILVNPEGGNTDQAFQSMYNSVANYGSEFIEIYNTSNCNAIDISCWTIGGMDGGTNGGAFSFPSGTIIPPLGFITIGGPNTANISFNLNLAANSGRLWRSNASRWHLPNGDGWVALYNESGVAVDAVYWTFASNDPNKLNNDATFTSGVLQRISACGGGGLATASTIAGIEYISPATVAGQSYERTTDGGSTWALAPSTPNNCNGNCTSTVFSLNATIVQPTCGNNNGSISFAPSPSDTFFYSWPFPSSSTVSSQSGLSPGTYAITITNTTGCSIDTTIILADVPCGNVCDPTGNLVIYSNYDGGILTINVDQNIPNLKVGICTYEPIQVTFTGPFVGNITQVIYAGMNSNQNNDNCGLGNFTTSITGVPAGMVTISPPMNPPSVGYTPAHGNGSGPWGGGMLGVSGNCDTLINGGGGNTPDEVVYYFLNATSGTLLYHQTQYACWVNETLNVSAGGNCCILPPGANPCPPVTTTSSQINVTCDGGSDGSATVVASGGTTFTYTWSPSGGSNATATGLSAGNYTCTITNECGNSTTQTFAITETVTYQLNATVIQPSCGNNNGCIYFNPSPAGTYFYEWPFPTIMIVDSVCELAPGSYDITINSAEGCPIDTTIILANSNAATIDANPETSTINFGDSVQLNTTGGVSYTWNPSSSLTCFDCPDPTAQPSQNTTYIVTGTDINGCSGSDTVVINVIPLPQPNFEFPNVITPNSDGTNDIFEIQNLPENTEVLILNRWGNIVFSSDNYQNNWDGKDNSGKELVDGVYTYKFKTQDGKNGHGFVTLIR
jgi:gliding motility-associated-like protein